MESRSLSIDDVILPNSNSNSFGLEIIVWDQFSLDSRSLLSSGPSHTIIHDEGVLTLMGQGAGRETFLGRNGCHTRRREMEGVIRSRNAWRNNLFGRGRNQNLNP